MNVSGNMGDQNQEQLKELKGISSKDWEWKWRGREGRMLFFILSLIFILTKKLFKA